MVPKSCVPNLVKISPYITPESRKRKELGISISGTQVHDVDYEHVEC